MIQQTYGPNNKTRFQIILEHTTLLLGDVKQNIILTKEKALIYRSEERWIQRVNHLEEMGKEAKHPAIVHAMLSIPDATGKGLVSIACENNCPNIVSYLLERGFSYNKKDDSGATPCYYAFNSKFGREAHKRLPYTAKYEYPRPKPSEWNYEVLFVQLPQHHNVINDEVVANSLPKKKKIKSKLYKQQFGPKR